MSGILTNDTPIYNILMKYLDEYISVSDKSAVNLTVNLTSLTYERLQRELDMICKVDTFRGNIVRGVNVSTLLSNESTIEVNKVYLRHGLDDYIYEQLLGKERSMTIDEVCDLVNWLEVVFRNNNNVAPLRFIDSFLKGEEPKMWAEELFGDEKAKYQKPKGSARYKP